MDIYFFISMCLTVIVILGLIFIRTKYRIDPREGKIRLLRELTFLFVLITGMSNYILRLICQVKFQDDSYVAILISKDFLIPLFMFGFNVIMSIIINSMKIIPIVKSDEDPSIINNYLNTQARYSKMLKYYYSLACFGVILITCLYDKDQVYTWVLTLIGGWIWFGSFGIRIKYEDDSKIERLNRKRIFKVIFSDILHFIFYTAVFGFEIYLVVNEYSNWQNIINGMIAGFLIVSGICFSLAFYKFIRSKR